MVSRSTATGLKALFAAAVLTTGIGVGAASASAATSSARSSRSAPPSVSQRSRLFE